ncbi:MAG TPA: AMP-binding protein, partial [Marisediminicola sp.]|nr:AMP-binding protein [Marisediminicola sp.]
MDITSDRPWLAHYADGVPADIEPPTESLAQMVEASVARFDRKVALEFFGAETSYRELGSQILRAAEGLRRLGVRKGDRVAIVLPNCPQHVVAFYAVLRLGAIAVEHNPLYTAREMRHQFEDHGARVAIVWDKAVAIVQGMPPDAAIDAIVSVDLTRAMPLATRLKLRLPVPAARKARAALTAKTRGTLAWGKLVDGGELTAAHPLPSVEDIAVLQYTSGTTGSPKGAMLTHSNLAANAAQGRAWVPGLVEGRETIYAVLPM